MTSANEDRPSMPSAGPTEPGLRTGDVPDTTTPLEERVLRDVTDLDQLDRLLDGLDAAPPPERAGPA
jgi:hypothetical protein